MRAAGSKKDERPGRVFVYSIGLGWVDEEELGKLVAAIGGLQPATFPLFKYNVKHFTVKNSTTVNINHQLMHN